MRPILLAEDSEDDALFARSTLKKAGIITPVIMVSDGAQAIDYLKGEGFYADRDSFPLPDVFLLDLKMPKKDGLAVLEWWRSQPHLQNMLVVVLSGFNDFRSVQRAYSLGARSFLVKPCKVEDIVNLRQAFAAYWNQPTPQSLLEQSNRILSTRS